MIRKGGTTIPCDDFAASAHDLFHAILAELLGIPYVRVCFGEFNISPDRKARAYLEIDGEAIDSLIAQSKGTTAERQLLFDLSLVARIARTADRVVLKLLPEDIARRAAGDDEALDKFFAKADLSAQDKASIIEQADRWLESARIPDGKFEIAVRATLRELIDKKEMLPPQIKAVIEKFGVETDLFPSGKPVVE